MKHRIYRIVIVGAILGVAVFENGTVRIEAAPAATSAVAREPALTSAPSAISPPAALLSAMSAQDSYLAVTQSFHAPNFAPKTVVPSAQSPRTTPSGASSPSSHGTMPPASAPPTTIASPAATTPAAQTQPVADDLATDSNRPALPISTADPSPTAAPSVLPARHEDEQTLVKLAALCDHATARNNDSIQAISEGERQLSSFTNVLQQAMMEQGSDTSGLSPFVKVALRYAGTPYVWGGESRDGFDCSGFIIRVMRDLGYEAPPHSAAEQFGYGKPIAQELLKPGDLVFFANTYKPGVSHVGIYLGHRRFIQAAGTGKGTIVSSLDDPRYQEKYAGARRLVPVGAN